MIRSISTAARATVPRATMGETVGVVAHVIGPIFAQGVIIRRPKVVALAERFDLNRRAVQYMQRLRNKYGTGPLQLRIPLPYALILAPDQVWRVLDQSPEPFATASREKRAALSHFQPQGVLISHGAARTDRRRFNEQVLDAHAPMHHLAARFTSVVDEEADQMLAVVRDRAGQLGWDDFAPAWFRIVRRIVLGDSARDDENLTKEIAQLRGAANWAFLRPKRRILCRQFYRHLNTYLARAEPGSLAAIMAATPTTRDTAPDQQVPQWLFAFDPAGMTTFRTLALLAAHPQQAARVREEIAQHGGAARTELPFLRACILESLRLWPTTPMVLRQTTAPTTWETGTLRAQTGLITFANFFHRDDQRLAYANRFTPDLWLDDRAAAHWPLIPFSAGPAVCPGRYLVLLLSSAMLAAILHERQVWLQAPGWLSAARPLPGTLSPYKLRFKLDG